MAIYLKKFENHTEYETYTASTEFITPNVSLCEQENEVHYSPYIAPPCNIITYTASAILPEGGATQYYKKPGYNPAAFGVTLVSHTFENGAGTFEFDGDVTTIGNDAFYQCSGLTSIDIPNSVTTIGNDAFTGCFGLTSIDIPNGVTDINDHAFLNCYSLTSITIPNSVTTIGYYAFSSCSGLTSIDIPNSVTSIGAAAFQSCIGLTSITIPSGVTSISGSVFESCSSLTSITIPNSVTSIGLAAFSSCSGLTSITVEATTPPTLGHANAFSNTNDCPIYVPSGSVEAYKSASGWSDYANRIQATP